MREIKFRAWNKKDSEWANINQLTDWNTCEMTACIGMGNEKFPYQTMRIESDAIYELMQYTGLKDKNGKEIYEGDVLCVLEDVVADTIDGFDRYEKEGDFMEVVFDKYGRWSVKGNSMVDGELLHDVLSDAQIIGNIYESPELLTN